MILNSVMHHLNIPSHLCLLAQEFIFNCSLFFFSHPLLMFFEILPLPGLKVEPCVGEGTDLGEQSLNEWMELILRERKKHTTE